MKETTLVRVEHDLAAGDYGQARDRLHGLIATYPDDLTLRQRLGEVYWRLQYPAMAGRYWYLEEDRSPVMAAARRAFERSCGEDPLQILLALKFRGELETVGDGFARRTLLDLQKRARKQRGVYVEFGKSGRERYRYAPTELHGSRGNWMLVGCVAGAIMALGLMGIGLVTVLQWIF